VTESGCYAGVGIYDLATHAAAAVSADEAFAVKRLADRERGRSARR
jgi:hypothetical protein